MAERTPPWMVALEAQLDLIRWSDSRACHDIVESQLGLEMAYHGGGENGPWEPSYLAWKPEHVIGLLKDSWLRGATYWIAPEMVDLVLAAGKSMPGVNFTPDHLPSPSGFAYFAKDWFIEGQSIAPVAASSPTGMHVIAISWSTTELANGEVGAFVCLHDDISRVRQPGDVHVPDPVPARYEEIPFGQLSPGAVESVTHGVLLSYWILCQQRVASISRGHVDRGRRRRAERLGLPLDVEDGIRVVTLRRQAPSKTEPSAEGQHTEWSCRWVVDGHWRQQWYPSSEEHRPVWIAPHVKGPDDAPLVLKDRVYRFVR